MMLNLLNLHYHIHENLFFDNCIIRDTFTVYSSKAIDDIFWNYANISELSSFRKSHKDILADFEALHRKPCIYINSSQSNDLRDLLEAKFIVKYTEEWLRYDGSKLESPQKTRQVSTKDEFNDFTTLFNLSNNLKFPHSDIYTSNYIALMNKTFSSSNFHHFIAYDNNIPVAVASLGYYNGYCIIYNQATHPDYRGKGYTQSLIKACIDKCQEMNGKEVYVLVNADSTIEKWYLKHDFKKIYNGYGLSI